MTDLAAVPAAVVVNCTGLGARALVPDPAVRPGRGQLVVVENPGVTEWFTPSTLLGRLHLLHSAAGPAAAGRHGRGGRLVPGAGPAHRHGDRRPVRGRPAGDPPGPGCWRTGWACGRPARRYDWPAGPSPTAAPWSTTTDTAAPASTVAWGCARGDHPGVPHSLTTARRGAGYCATSRPRPAAGHEAQPPRTPPRTRAVSRWERAAWHPVPGRRPEPPAQAPAPAPAGRGAGERRRAAHQRHLRRRTGQVHGERRPGGRRVDEVLVRAGDDQRQAVPRGNDVVGGREVQGDRGTPGPASAGPPAAGQA